MGATVFQNPAFVWACAALAGGCLAAAVAVRAKKFLRGLSEQFVRQPPVSKAVLATAEVITPQSIEPRDVGFWTVKLPKGEAGGVGLEFDLYVRSFDVSFAGLAVEEVPCDVGERSGYFMNNHFTNLLSHTIDNGAGKWLRLSPDHLRTAAGKRFAERWKAVWGGPCARGKRFVPNAAWIRTTTSPY